MILLNLSPKIFWQQISKLKIENYNRFYKIYIIDSNINMNLGKCCNILPSVYDIVKPEFKTTF